MRAEKKVAAATHQYSRFVFFGSEVCCPRITAKKRTITAECPLFHLHFNAQIGDQTPSRYHPIFKLASQPQADKQPQRIVSAFTVPYLAASPQSQDKVLFSQLTGGWCWTPFTPTPAVPPRMLKFIPEVCYPTGRQLPLPQREVIISALNYVPFLFIKSHSRWFHLILMFLPCKVSFVYIYIIFMYSLFSWASRCLSLSSLRHNTRTVSTWTPPPLISYQTAMPMHSPLLSISFHRCPL